MPPGAATHGNRCQTVAGRTHPWRVTRQRRRHFRRGVLGGLRALPIAAEIHRRAAAHRQPRDAINLLAVADAAQVLAPGRLLGVANKIGSGDMVVVSEFAAPQTREIGFRAVGAGAIDAVALLVVDPLHGEASVQRVPGRLSSACTVVPLAIRRRMAATASASAANTCAKVRPPRSHMATTTRRLPDWVSASRRSIRSAARFSGRMWPPK